MLRFNSRQSMRMLVLSIALLCLGMLFNEPAGAAEKITISGVVTADNNPVSGARIYFSIQDTYNYSDYRAEKAAKTKKDGSFEFTIDSDRLAGNRWISASVVVYSKKYAIGWAQLLRGSARENLKIKLGKAASVSGTVQDSNGNPIKNATVTIRHLNIGYMSRTPPIICEIHELTQKTGSDGIFELNNLPENINLGMLITAEDYGRVENMGVRSGYNDLQFILEPEGRIEGSVIYAPNGKPAKDVTIAVQNLDYTAGRYPHIVTTNRKGNFTLSHLKSGMYTVKVLQNDRSKEWVNDSVKNIAVESEQTTQNVNLSLIEGGIVTGTIGDKETGEPIEGQRVGARPDGMMSYSESFSAYTDKAGFYQLRVIPGKLRIYSSSPEGYTWSYESVTVDIKEGETVDGTDFLFSKGISITGKALSPDGSSVPGVVIIGGRNYRRGAMWQGMVTSDTEGNFTISGLNEGMTYSFKAENSEKRLRGNIEAEISPDNDIVIQLEKYETATVKGRIVSEQGSPLAGVEVWVYISERGGRSRTMTTNALTDRSGRYTVDSMIIGENYSLIARADRYADCEIPLPELTGEMPELEDVVMKVADHWIEGTVTDSEGSPVVGERLLIYDGSMGQKQAVTDTRGHYRIDYLSPTAETRLMIDSAEYGYYNFSNIKTNEQHDITLISPKYFLSGQIVNDEGKPVENAQISIEPRQHESGLIYRSTRTGANGEFDLPKLLDEKITLRVGHRELGQKFFEDVITNRENVTFVMEQEQPETESGSLVREIAGTGKGPVEGTPDLKVSQWLNCKPVTLADLKGKIVVLDFWTCSEKKCLDTLSKMKTIREKYGDKGVVVIGVHEFTENCEHLSKVIEEQGIEYRIAVDNKSSNEGSKGQTFEAYDVKRYSMNTIIDREGNVQSDVWDALLESKIRGMIR